MTLPSVPNPVGVGAALTFNRDPLGTLLAWRREYGPHFVAQIASSRLHVITDADDLYTVLVGRAKDFNKRDSAKESLGPLLGRGLLLSDGDFWRRQRRLAQPAFHHKRIVTYATQMVAYAGDVVARWQPGQTYDIADEMTGLTLRIVARTLFNVETGDVTHRVSDALDVLLPTAARRARLPVRLPVGRRVTDSLEALDALVYAFIEERRADPTDRGDLLSMLMAATDEDDGTGMTDQALRDEIMTIFLAGHETTASALAWTFYLLSQHPEVEARLLAEVDAVGHPPTYDAIADLPTTLMVVKEALRLYPPAWLFSRQATTDVALKRGVVAAGEGVWISPYAIHREADVFPDPERFDPDRFTPEREAAIPRTAYIPFSTGPRVCIGNSFALMEAQLILATILQRVRLRLAPGAAVEPLADITLRPKGDLPMVVEAR
ncbi:MAG: cytochrome P450 [Chloroflexi bacterium]|nr:cytochrome P450 [Chloroflexota bacterium]